MLLSKILVYIISYMGLFASTFFFLNFFERLGETKNPKPGRLPVVTVAVPAYNEEKTIAETIKSLLQLDYPREKLEIMVIDDGSKDNTYRIAKRFEKQGALVFSKPNTGKGSSLNFALKRSRGELFGALDADSFVNSDCLKKMVGYFNDPKIMAVTPSLKIYRPKGILQRIQAVEYMIGIYLRKVFSMLGSIHVTPGPFTIYRKSFFKKHGGYDENNITEDIEIALRIQSKRYNIENSIDSSVYTVGPSKFRALSAQRKRWYVGFMDNVFRYKKLFSPSFGNLGVFVLPMSLIFVLMVVIICINSAITYGTRIYQDFYNLMAVDFDIMSLFNLNFDLFMIRMDTLVFLSITLIAVSLGIIFIAKRYSEEKSPLALSYVLYMAIYWFVFAYWWVVSGVCKATKRKIAWGKKTG